MQYAKRNAGYDQSTLYGVWMNLLFDLICPYCVENEFTLMGVWDSRQWSMSQFFGLNTAYPTVCGPGYLQRKDEGLRD